MLKRPKGTLVRHLRTRARGGQGLSQGGHRDAICCTHGHVSLRAHLSPRTYAAALTRSAACSSLTLQPTDVCLVWPLPRRTRTLACHLLED